MEEKLSRETDVNKFSKEYKKKNGLQQKYQMERLHGFENRDISNWVSRKMMNPRRETSFTW